LLAFHTCYPSSLEINNLFCHPWNCPVYNCLSDNVEHVKPFCLEESTHSLQLQCKNFTDAIYLKYLKNEKRMRNEQMETFDRK
jgi:hypothetical protein